MNPELDTLLRMKPVVLIFLPGVTEATRFVASGAFDPLARRHVLHYIVPAGLCDEMRGVAPEAFGPSSFSEVPVRSSGADTVTLLGDSGPLVDSLHDGLAPLPEIVALIDRVNPLFCIACTSVPDLFCHHVAWACEREKVTCVILQSGFGDLAGRVVLPPARPIIGLWGPESARRAKVAQGNHHIPEHALGIPYSPYLGLADPVDVEGVRRQFGVEPHERLVLFAGAYPESGEVGMLRRLEEGIGDGRLSDVKVVYRPHPRSMTARLEEAFRRRALKHVVFEPALRGQHVPERPDSGGVAQVAPATDLRHVALLIRSADAVIGPPSSLLVESLIQDTRAMVLFDGAPPDAAGTTPRMALFSALQSSGALSWSAKKKRVVRDLLKLFRPDKALQRARVAAVKEMVTSGPGTYADRFDVFCQKSVEPRAKSLRYKRAGARRGTISHTYGANGIAARYCGLAASDRSVPGYWMHGWVPEYHNVAPILIALHKRKTSANDSEYLRQIGDERERVPQFVSRLDQADYLRAHGYGHVEAIGLPVTYLSARHVPRASGSLLVLPPHGHKSHGPGDPLAEEYAAAIADLKARFERIVVGLTEDDFVKEEWVTAFDRHGIDVVITAQQSDQGTIVRLAEILSTFEYVTTNGFGSQIAYAAYFGAKVSVYGPYANFSHERMASIEAIRTFPELLDQAVYLCGEDALRRHYPFLFVEPDRAVPLTDWGAREVGAQNRVSPEALAGLFGWASGPASGPGQGDGEFVGVSQERR